MTYTVESKNQLAKLLATENLTIEHRKVSTASFDMKNRVLTCPIWKDMSGDLYDLFMGHEVGHALETPLEGWHDSVSNKGKNYKHFLNVVEDARIEKKIKRRYPGLKRSFVSAYNRLADDDFFGVKYQNLNNLSLIDKINLHFKCGISMGIKFTDAEMEYVKQIESCETWDDVVAITDKLFEYCKGEQQQQNETQQFHPDFDFDDYQTGSGFVDEMEESENESSDFDETESESNNTTDSEENSDEESDSQRESNSDSEENSDEESDSQRESNSDSEENSDEESEDTEETGKTTVHDKESADSNKDQFEPKCETDEYFRKNELSLLDSDCLPYVYINIPKPNLEHIVTPQKRVQGLLTEAFKHKDRKKNLAEFKRKNDNYVGLLAKEFEMRKAATRYAKRKISNTGDIDVNKIYKYQLEDSIFRKITKVPNGKSHGLILLLDCSGSMSSNINGAIEQIMVLAMFCRRVNIPFIVYGFGNNAPGWSIDHPNSDGARISFTSNANQIEFTNVSLREYLNSEMSNGEFTNALANLATLKKCFESAYSRIEVPKSEQLSNTPLTQAMVALKPIVEKFRKVRKLDIVNLAIVHDGDADYCSKYKNSDRITNGMVRNSANYVIVDKNTKYQFKLDFEEYNHESVRIAIFNWFTQVTGTKVFGFFIVPDSAYKMREAITNMYYIDGEKFANYIAKKHKIQHYYIRDHSETEIKRKEFKDKKLLVSKNPGYEKFFLILGGKSLITDYDELGVEEGASIRKLKNAFTKKYNHRKVNRVLVNQFIEGIAA